MTKFITKQLTMEAELIVKVAQATDVNADAGAYDCTTETGRVARVIWKNAPKEGDFLNVTNLDDIYHMPKHIVVGPDAKYEPKPDLKDAIQIKIMDNPIMKYFAYYHLPEKLQKISKPIGELAETMDTELPNGPEKSAGLRKLLEAKDCLVRAFL